MRQTTAVILMATCAVAGCFGGYVGIPLDPTNPDHVALDEFLNSPNLEVAKQCAGLAGLAWMNGDEKPEIRELLDRYAQSQGYSGIQGVTFALSQDATNALYKIKDSRIKGRLLDSILPFYSPIVFYYGEASASDWFSLDLVNLLEARKAER